VLAGYGLIIAVSRWVDPQTSLFLGEEMVKSDDRCSWVSSAYFRIARSIWARTRRSRPPTADRRGRTNRKSTRYSPSARYRAPSAQLASIVRPSPLLSTHPLTMGPAINLLRTRLQASGSSGHPQVYKGFVDVLQQTLKNEGPRGLYKGLLPSTMKVGPAVGVSWIVYEDMKRRLGV